MQVKLMFFFENCTFTCITDTWHRSYAGKLDVFFVMISKLDLPVCNTFRMRSPANFCESIVHLMFVSNFGCQYSTVFLNQLSDVNIDAAATAASLNLFRPIMSDEALWGLLGTCLGLCERTFLVQKGWACRRNPRLEEPAWLLPYYLNFLALFGALLRAFLIEICDSRQAAHCIANQQPRITQHCFK